MECEHKKRFYFKSSHASAWCSECGSLLALPFGLKRNGKGWGLTSIRKPSFDVTSWIFPRKPLTQLSCAHYNKTYLPSKVTNNKEIFVNYWCVTCGSVHIYQKHNSNKPYSQWMGSSINGKY